MDALRTETVDAFLARVADGTPVPGGGGAAALTVALAAALVGMVCRVTARRAPSTPLDDIADAADRCRERAAVLIDDDARAYRGVVDSRRASAANAARDALVHATEVPLDIARAGVEVLRLAERLAPDARPSTRSDLVVAAALALAAVDAAAHTARSNCAAIDDASCAGALEREAVRLAAEADATARRVRDHVTRASGVA